MSTAADNHRDEELKLLGTKISALPQTIVLTDDDVFIVNENDQNTKKIQYSDVKKDIFAGDITFTGEITFLYPPKGFTLNSLIDVQVINSEDQDVLQYDAASQLWKPQSLPELTQGERGPEGPQGPPGP